MRINISLAAAVSPPKIDGLSNIESVIDHLRSIMPSSKTPRAVDVTGPRSRSQAFRSMFVGSTDGRRLYMALKSSRDWNHHSSMSQETFDHKSGKVSITVIADTEVRVSAPRAPFQAAASSISLSARPMSPKHAATAWIVVYDASTQKYLMLKRAKGTNNPNLWNFPGGGIDEGDTPAAGAKRELLEEAGIKIKKSDMVRIAETMDGTIHYFLLIVEETPVLRVDAKESSKHKWMTMDEIIALGNKLHSKTALFVNTKIYRRLTNMAIRKSGMD